MKYRCVACHIVDIRLIQDHFGIWKLRQRPRLPFEPANCIDPAPRNMQLSLSIVVLWRASTFQHAPIAISKVSMATVSFMYNIQGLPYKQKVEEKDD